MKIVRVVVAGLALTVVACNGSGVGTQDGAAGTTGTGSGGRGGTTGAAGTTGSAGTTGVGGRGGAAGAGGLGGGGGSGTAGRGGSGGAGRGGSGGSGGSGGAGGAGGAGGVGGTVASTCPSSPPQAGAPCNVQSCFYEDCAGVGRTTASCANGVWVVDRAPCAAATCPGIGASVTCPAGQICSQRAGGAVQPVECVSNGCGTGPISCDCLLSCAGTCTVTGSAATGFHAFCNTCPQLGCP